MQFATAEVRRKETIMRTLDISIIASLALGWIGTAVAAEELCGNEVMA